MPGGKEVFRHHVAELLRRLGVEPDPAQHPRSQLRTELARHQPLPEKLLVPLIATAVADPDPSFSRFSIEPALLSFGRRRVRAALLDRLRTGTNPERAGAVRAWYWTALPVAAGEDTADVNAAWHEATLREFIGNEDLDVRRCLIPDLRLSPAEDPLVARVIAIARAHPDSYIRHRVEVQLGG